MTKVKASKGAKALVPMDGFTFGCDPELFIVNKEGKYVSAAGLIPGTKEVPFPVRGGGVQVDGMAAEITIDPASTFEEFNNNISSVVIELSKMLPEGFTLSAVPSVRFDKELFDAAPDEAKQLGCSPDFNAWTGEVNPPPILPNDPYLRSGGGHLHIGWTEGVDLSDIQHIGHCRDLVKQFDWHLGGWAVAVDKDPTRRSLYGRAGACRYKPYGVEYRVLSNFWVLDESLRLAVWNRMQMAINDMRKAFIPDRAGGYNDLLVQGINESRLNTMLTESFRYPLTRATKSVREMELY